MIKLRTLIELPFAVTLGGPMFIVGYLTAWIVNGFLAGYKEQSNG